MLVYWFHFVVFVIGSCDAEENYSEENNDMDIRTDSFRKKWGVEHVMRNLEHIKEDMKEMVDLKATGKLTQLDMLFYMIRMHDFDDNGGLDGIEFRTALTHTMEHNQNLTEEFKKEKTEELIENLLKVDDNNDGIVDYGELRSHIEQEQRDADSNKQKEET